METASASGGRRRERRGWGTQGGAPGWLAVSESLQPGTILSQLWVAWGEGSAHQDSQATQGETCA